jgi:hypothetical protein
MPRLRLGMGTHLVGHFQRQESLHNSINPLEKDTAMRDKHGGRWERGRTAVFILV